MSSIGSGALRPPKSPGRSAHPSSYIRPSGGSSRSSSNGGGQTTPPAVPQRAEARPNNNNNSSNNNNHTMSGMNDPAASTSAGASSRASQAAHAASTLLLTPAERVRRWRASQNAAEVPEEELVRDVIYLLQGIDGQWVRFHEQYVLPGAAAQGASTIDAQAKPEKVVSIVFEEDAHHVITRPRRELIHRITELGRLYRRIQDFLALKRADPSAGLAMQSLCHFLEKEMSEYYRLIAALETQLNSRGASGAGASSSSTSLSGGIAGDGAELTLRRVALFTQDSLLRIRLLSSIIEQCHDSKGGALASLIHSYSFNGDTLIRSLTSDLLEEVSRPFFSTLSKWIFEGELHDPFGEFFVQVNEQHQGYASNQQDTDAASFWLHRFSIRPDMLPSFLTPDFGRKIFSTGKSLNFIRYACGADDWLESQTQSQEQRKLHEDLRYSDIEGLQRTVSAAHQVVSKQLVDIFLNKLKLLDHLRALQDYLMLGKGDFVDLLKSQLEEYLNRPSNTLHRHQLTIALETAIRGSNAQHDDPEVIKRLDARLLEDSAGDTGWDVFTLEYKVDSPVNTILDGPAMQAYQLIFAHLWRIKRSEVALAETWSRASSSRFELQKMRKANPSSNALLKTLNKALTMLSEMNHMTRQLQGFCSLECAAYSWQDLTTSLKGEVDLDELIDRHQKYVNALVSKVLLRQSTKRSDPDFLANEVRAMLTTILAFCAVCTELSHYIFAFVQGNEDEHLHRSIATRLEEQSRSFQERLQTVLERLERHSNLIVRELATRLNFNVYYEGARRERRRDATQAISSTPAATAAA